MKPTNKMRPIHPGEILREEFLIPLGMSAHALALELKVPAPRINDIVRERRAITPDTALRLARYFGNTPQFWLNLQTSYDLKIAERKISTKIDTLPRLNKKIVTVTSLNNIEEEKEYWLSKNPLARIEAIEINRRMVYGPDQLASRLQRFFETAELTKC
jgi:antitoxin HigA-1